ncbi:MAG: bifunctional metallophosphatase/5'-nucleotidase [Cellulosilyticum sp.]|nr:bifunctional metallophosphatase/5'-nucleotidase [Cellulosilyticum sp.]
MNKTVKLYYTSDTHGYMFPTDYVNKADKNMGLLSCINEFKKDGNTLILDAGDTIQGSVFSKHMWENTTEGCMIAEVFNQGNYDYFTLGNHDFNHGYQKLARYIGTSNAQCIVANIVDKTGELGIKPYVIHTLENGLKVGIVGLVTDYVTLWEKPENLEQIDVLDTFTAAKNALAQMKDQCDISICLYHGGYECDLETGKKLAEGKENVGYRICEELDFDVLLTGHQHMPTAGRMIHGTYTMQVAPNAQQYGFVQIELDGEKIVEIISENKVPEICKDNAKATWLEEQEAVQVWLDSKLGSFSEEIPALSKLEVAVNGGRLADLCNQIQLEYTGAEISCTSLGNNPVGFSKDVTIREIVAAYQFPNTMKVLEVDETIIRKALERCAEYFTLREDGEIVISDCFIKPKEEHYNYDFFAGIEYTFDITKPVGSRVVRLEKNGKPLENRKYTLVMNDYRATGTGGYAFYQDCKIAKEYTVDTQEMIIEYVKNKQVVTIMDKPDFKIVK